MTIRERLHTVYLNSDGTNTSTFPQAAPDNGVLLLDEIMGANDSAPGVPALPEEG
jgi:hypothetical protein